MTTLLQGYRELSREETHALLGRNRLGRLAYSVHNQVDVEPVPYVYHDAWIYGRATPGLKLRTIEQNRFVAFQVDEMTGADEWRSVLVRGAFYVLSPEGSLRDHETWEQASELLAPLYPPAPLVGPAGGSGTGEEGPGSGVIFRISAHHAAGRACEGLPS